MDWTDEHNDLIKKLWLEGMSGGKIGKRLGVSRNAVISRVRRMGIQRNAGRTEAKPLTRRPQILRLATTQAPPRTEPRESIASRVTLPSRVFVADEPGTTTILTLGRRECKWPIGDPSLKGFSFCGRRIEDGEHGPYCCEHANLAYRQPHTDAQSRRKSLERSVQRYL
jgi:GcrA cell cycle regulator